MLVCEFCNKEFTSVSSLNNHRKNAKYCLEIQGKNNENFICVCEKGFTSKENLNKHEEKCLIVGFQNKIKYLELTVKTKNKECMELKKSLNKKTAECEELNTLLNKKIDDYKKLNTLLDEKRKNHIDFSISIDHTLYLEKDIVYIYNFEPTGIYQDIILKNDRKYYEFGVTSNIYQRNLAHKKDKNKEKLLFIKAFEFKNRFNASRGEKMIKNILDDLNLRIKYYNNTECFLANYLELQIIYKKIEETIL